jgi:hypothetical protein
MEIKPHEFRIAQALEAIPHRPAPKEMFVPELITPQKIHLVPMEFGYLMKSAHKVKESKKS